MADTVEVQSIFGQIEVFPDDLITEHIVSFGAHTRPELAFLLSVIRPGDDVFDIGGHVGTFAIPIAQKIGSAGHLLVVEAYSKNLALLRRNLKRLDLNATVVHAVIGDPAKRYIMQDADLNTGSERNSGAHAFIEAKEGVSAIRIDDLLGHFTPRVVKIDIEGLEFAALNASPNLLVTRPILYLEIVSTLLERNNCSVKNLDCLLRSHGYRLFRNLAERNAAHDDYVVGELSSLADGGTFFDVLAIHRDDLRASLLKQG
jgi:FkbM family methyltransferase